VLFRTALIGGIWAWVHFTTSRLLARLGQLEQYLRLCSWCRKIDHEGQWLTTEEYFGSRFETESSHGICPACAHERFNQFHASARGPATRDRGNTFSDFGATTCLAVARKARPTKKRARTFVRRSGNTSPANRSSRSSSARGFCMKR
jgi:hypothetical protein